MAQHPARLAPRALGLTLSRSARSSLTAFPLQTVARGSILDRRGASTHWAHQAYGGVESCTRSQKTLASAVHHLPDGPCSSVRYWVWAGRRPTVVLMPRWKPLGTARARNGHKAKRRPQGRRSTIP